MQKDEGVMFQRFFHSEVSGSIVLLAVRSGKTSLPEGITWPQILGGSILAGVGFTMSIFIGDLAFKSVELITQAKTAIIFASLLSGIAGFLVLRRVLRK